MKKKNENTPRARERERKKNFIHKPFDDDEDVKQTKQTNKQYFLNRQNKNKQKPGI